MAPGRKPPRIRSVALYCHNKPEKEKAERAFVEALLKFFKKRRVEIVHGDVRSVSMMKNQIGLINDDTHYDLKIGIGGDGTLLKMMRTLQRNDGLLLGVNFGTLGFLSEVMPETAMRDVKRVFNGEFFVDERMLIKAFVWRQNGKGEKEKIFSAYALNDIVLGHGGLARLMNFHIRVNRRLLSDYKSDGLIFATPTGSTAYSLSVGGPIITPTIDSILVCPIAPHTLTHRPILLPDNKVIHLSFDGRAESISMTIDGQVHFSLKPTDEVSIHRAHRTARFIRLRESHYFRTLRGKLGWGEKKR